MHDVDAVDFLEENIAKDGGYLIDEVTEDLLIPPTTMFKNSLFNGNPIFKLIGNHDPPPIKPQFGHVTHQKIGENNCFMKD